MNTTQTKPSTPASEFFSDVEQLAINLYCRWLDERDYEDDAEYLSAFQQVASRHSLIVRKFHRRPWGITFVDNSDGYKEYRLTINSSNMAYKRVK